MDTYIGTLAQTGFQLQIWNSKTRTYIPAVSETERANAWRICKPERSLKPARYVTPHPDGKSRTAHEVRAQYLQWESETP